MRSEDRYDSLIKYYADFTNLDWHKVKAQIKAESAFNPRAKSGAGAKGLGQFMPPTWVEWGTGDIYNPEDNISATCRYMRWLLNSLNQDDRLAFAAYNWGIGNVKKAIGYDTASYDISAFIAALPSETKKYITRINQYYVDYQHEELQKGRTGQT